MSVLNWADEPFSRVLLRDAALFGGAPLAALICGIWWCRIARRRRVGWVVFVSGAAWFVLMSFCSISTLLAYFHEPWNR
jgi:hypothetical protein